MSTPRRAPKSYWSRREGRISGKPLAIVNILVPRQPTVYRLPHDVGRRQLGVLPRASAKCCSNERSEALPLIQLSHHEQAAVRSDARTLEVDLQPAFEREVKGLFLRRTQRRSLPHRVNPKPASISAFRPFHPIGSPLEKRKSGFRLPSRSRAPL